MSAKVGGVSLVSMVGSARRRLVRQRLATARFVFAVTISPVRVARTVSTTEPGSPERPPCNS
jgi:hypothetical protein